ncbi:hypothetical protein SLA2020_329980 [Shorea laevis]
MAEGKYVTLRKQQAPLEDITPGELNQAAQVPQLVANRCTECRQPLPESYERPADEDWTTGICGCAEDPESCWTGLFCPCVLFGHNMATSDKDIDWSHACMCHAVCIEGGMAMAAATLLFPGIDPTTLFLIWESLIFGWWMFGIYNGMCRGSLQRKYHLKNSPCDPFMVHCCMHWCALCQEHREMKNHLSDSADMQMTVVRPPPAQEMSTDENQESASAVVVSAPSSGNDDQSKLEIQPV